MATHPTFRPLLAVRSHPLSVVRRPLALFTLLLAGQSMCMLHAQADDERAMTAAQSQAMALRDVLGLNERHSFRVKSLLRDDQGRVHARLDQLFGGVRVVGGDAIFHGEDERFRSADAASFTETFFRDIAINPVPFVGAKEAIAVADQAMGRGQVYVREPQCELVIEPRMKGSTRAAAHGQRRAKAYRLVYRVLLATHGMREGFTEMLYTIDAQTGALLDRRSELRTADKGVGYSQYSGQVALDTHPHPRKGFELRDMTRSKGGNATFTFQEGQAGPSEGHLVTDADNTWGDGQNYIGSGVNTDNGQTAAVDAHYAMQVTWDFYKNVLGRNGVDGKGTPIASRVHAKGRSPLAFWSDATFCVTFGDGDKTKGMSVPTALDIAAHEISHGLCSQTANLDYVGESGGLNEANSDILATMVEFYARGGGYEAQSKQVPDQGGNFEIGEQIAAKPLRHMDQPSKDGVSPDTWSEELGKMDVHQAAGPANRMFYLLSQGSASQGDAPNSGLASPAVEGLGNDVACRIWYRALTVYMKSNTDYHGAREAMIQAVQDLYGKGGKEEAAVWNAFAAIQVGEPWTEGETPHSPEEPKPDDQPPVPGENGSGTEPKDGDATEGKPSSGHHKHKGHHKGKHHKGKGKGKGKGNHHGKHQPEDAPSGEGSDKSSGGSGEANHGGSSTPSDQPQQGGGMQGGKQGGKHKGGKHKHHGNGMPEGPTPGGPEAGGPGPGPDYPGQGSHYPGMEQQGGGPGYPGGGQGYPYPEGNGYGQGYNEQMPEPQFPEANFPDEPAFPDGGKPLGGHKHHKGQGNHGQTSEEQGDDTPKPSSSKSSSSMDDMGSGSFPGGMNARHAGGHGATARHAEQADEMDEGDEEDDGVPAPALPGHRQFAEHETTAPSKQSAQTSTHTAGKAIAAKNQVGVDMTGLTSAGLTLSLREHAGKVIVMQIVSPTSKLSVQDVATFNDLYEKHRTKGLMCVTCVADGAGKGILAQWIASHKHKMPVMVDGAGKRGPAESFYLAATRRYPTYVILDKAFHVKEILTGNVSNVTSAALKLLGNAPVLLPPTNLPVMTSSDTFLRTELAFFTSDQCGGRLAGSVGEREASDRIAAFYQKAQLKPIKVSGFGGPTPYHLPWRMGKATAYNVGCMIEGTDPKLKKEFVVVSAHFDHLGKDRAGKPLPGASNVSGAVGIMQLAQSLKSAAPKRSILLVAFSGKESGCLGSQAFLAQCPVPASAIHANINLGAMGGSKGQSLQLLSGGAEAQGLSREVRDSLQRSGITLNTVLGGAKSTFDHTTFAAKQIPSLTLTGMGYGTATDTTEGIDMTSLQKALKGVQTAVVRVAAQTVSGPSVVTSAVSAPIKTASLRQ